MVNYFFPRSTWRFYEHINEKAMTEEQALDIAQEQQKRFNEHLGV